MFCLQSDYMPIYLRNIHVLVELNLRINSMTKYDITMIFLPLDWITALQFRHGFKIPES